MASASATSVQSQSSLPQNTCTVPLLGVRGPGGVQLVTSPVHSESVEKVLSHDVENCRLTCFSRSGHQFVMGDGTKVQVYCCNTRHVLYEINKRKICAIKYSPNDTYLLLFEPFSERYTNRLQLEGLQIFSMGKSVPPYTISAFVKGKKGIPDCVRLFQYPDLKSTIANKSFFNFDHVNMKWNYKGTALLVLCSSDMSENSYYGDTMLQHLNKNGDSSNITLSIDMPSKATMFNSKCDISWELSVGAKNAVYYNTDGTYLALCGFGNVSGNIEMWDVKARKQLIHINVPDTTYFQWCYDNYHFITATTAPRLRVNNGFKIWRLTGELIFEHRTSDNQELWQVLWQPGTYNRGNKQPIASDPSSTTTNISSKQKTPQAYRPPHLRNTTRQVPKLHDE
ncbi:unnamed protein product, partial [Didymodactylos carnosus]